ncbi:MULTISPECIES: ABC transporter permease [unclassified Streptomyces]|uniref:ABC transporter permease n=1 Tax=unclassified Streptomyces TaxID=2593676 RepID=UPI0011CCDAF2|nr:MULTISPECIES: ABC transporter permease [unclassified Streptomyces]WSQ76019.1 ABC transporter permease [Streptomyces sp. NBC_01213]TXS15235.1 ABC transporter permease [Streptomyces sp. wa22]WSQ83265.1 ABC transporter permease [Streptomyces sp. NBC_01212]WSR10704.1 ABC transporter permease [Streptomyces sp. NBC_01208]WSR46600.1 ABC transporter permease [Streptomyces sp. NBC_01201]
MNALRSWVARRLLLGAVQTAAVVLLVFGLTEALPGDAAVAFAGDQPDPQRIAAVREAMGLDRPAHERLADWVVGLLHGDFGTSLTSGRPVAGFLADGFGPTLLLATLTVLILVPVAVGLGVLAARHEGRLTDRLISSTTLGVYAVPEFALGVLLVSVFALRLGWFPPTAVGYGTDLLAHPAALVLPVLVLLARPVCSLARLVRAGMIDALAAPWTTHAGRYGIPGARIRYGHALPNALAPATQQLARTIDWLLCGVIVVEALYVIPGLGTVLMNAVADRDIPVVQGLAVVFGVATVVLNLGADLVTHRLAPRSGVAA